VSLPWGQTIQRMSLAVKFATETRKAGIDARNARNRRFGRQRTNAAAQPLLLRLLRLRNVHFQLGFGPAAIPRAPAPAPAGTRRFEESHQDFDVEIHLLYRCL